MSDIVQEAREYLEFSTAHSALTPGDMIITRLIAEVERLRSLGAVSAGQSFADIKTAWGGRIPAAEVNA